MRLKVITSVIVIVFVAGTFTFGYSETFNGIRLENKSIRFVFDKHRGGLISLVDKKTGVEFRNDPEAIPLLFRVTTVDRLGRELVLTNLDAVSFEYFRQEFPDRSTLILVLRDIGVIKAEVRCTVILPKESSLAEWYIDISSEKEFRLRSVEFPCFNGISSVGLDYKDDWYLYPCQEGVIMPRSRPYLFRLNYRPDCLFYPGDQSMQFMALYDKTAGLYTATYDTSGHAKRFEYYNADGHMRWQVLTLTSEEPRTTYKQIYPAVVGVFHGDWAAAAEIYRKWAWQQPWCNTPTIERSDLPDWFLQGEPLLKIHNYFEGPNSPEHLVFPLSELPQTVLTFSRALSSALTLCLVGWEHHAVWDNPLSMPPREGYDAFLSMVTDLHAQGNRVALARSVMRWASTSPGFERLGAPYAVIRKDGSLVFSHLGLFGGPSPRYAMCPATEAWKRRMEENAEETGSLGVDWLVMDECPLGYPHVCYNEAHGHPIGGGTWWAKETYDLLQRTHKAAQSTNPSIFCPMESPSEFYIPVADSYAARRSLADLYHYDEWARASALFPPIFQYIYHEYILPVQAPGLEFEDGQKNPDYFRLVCAKAMAGGEVLSAWTWNVAAAIPPNIKEIFKRHLEMWQGFAREFLAYGRMERPPEIEVPLIKIRSVNDKWGPYDLIVPAVIASAWTSPFGAKGYLFENVSNATQLLNPGESMEELHSDRPIAVIVRNSIIERVIKTKRLATTELKLEPGDILLVSLVDKSEIAPVLEPTDVRWSTYPDAYVVRFSAEVHGLPTGKSALGLLTFSARVPGSGEVVARATRLIPTLEAGQSWKVGGQLTLPWGMRSVEVVAELSHLSLNEVGENTYSFKSLWRESKVFAFPAPKKRLPGSECLAVSRGSLGFFPVDGFSAGSVPLDGWWYAAISRSSRVSYKALYPLPFDGQRAIIYQIPQNVDWHLFALQFAHFFDASEYEGIEIKIYAEQEGLCRLEFGFVDPAIPPEEGEEFGVSAGRLQCGLNVGPEVRTFRIPFTAIKVVPWIVEEHPEARKSFDPSRIVEIRFIPLMSSGKVAVLQLGFYRANK